MSYRLFMVVLYFTFQLSELMAIEYFMNFKKNVLKIYTMIKIICIVKKNRIAKPFLK